MTTQTSRPRGYRGVHRRPLAQFWADVLFYLRGWR